MKKIDYKKELKHLYNPSPKEPVVVDVPEMNFLMINGQGDPNTAREAKEAIEALYAVAYKIKFLIKKEKEVDYGVMPLEGLWWADDMSQFSQDNKDIWKWTYLIMQSEVVTEEIYERAVAEVKKKKNPPALPKMRLASFEEGPAAQIMYFGPYSDEGPTIKKLHQFINDQGGDFDGLKKKHHEIYLSDPRRTAPEKLKTVVRQPFRR